MAQKALLIMDAPDCCMECPCFRRDEYQGSVMYECMVKLVSVDLRTDGWVAEKRPDWCPLVMLQE